MAVANNLFLLLILGVLSMLLLAVAIYLAGLTFIIILALVVIALSTVYVLLNKPRR